MLIIAIIGMCIGLVVKSVAEGIPVGAVLGMYPMTIVLVLMGLVFGVFVAGMWGFHTYLFVTNTTTSEYLKKYYKLAAGNPFKK